MLTRAKYVTVAVQLWLCLALLVPALAQTKAPGKAPAPGAPAAAPAAPAPGPTGAVCGPDHKILYKRAVGLLDQADKKLNARYTAEAKSLAKEAKNLFAILQKECGAAQKERPLTPKEEQQEAVNKKLANDEQAQADRLAKSAEEKEKKSQQLEASQPQLSLKYEQEAKGEYEQAQKRSIKSMIYSLRTQQMLFDFLSK